MADDQLNSPTGSTPVIRGFTRFAEGDDMISHQENTDIGTDDLKSAASVFLNLLKKSKAQNATIASMKEISDIAKLFEEHKVLVQTNDQLNKPDNKTKAINESCNSGTYSNKNNDDCSQNQNEELQKDHGTYPKFTLTALSLTRQNKNKEDVAAANNENISMQAEQEGGTIHNTGKAEAQHFTRSLLKSNMKEKAESPLPQTIVVKVDPSSKSISSVNYALVKMPEPTHGQHKDKKREDDCSKTTAAKKSAKKSSQKNCRICGLVFSKKAILRVHMANVHKISVDFSPVAIDDEDTSQQSVKKKTKKKLGKKSKKSASKQRSEIKSKESSEENVENKSLATVFSDTNSTFKVQGPMFHCFYCDKEFYSKTNVLRHIWNHEKAKKYQCNLCDWTYNRAHELFGHLNKFHAEEKLSVSELPKDRDESTCNLCGEVFVSRYVLKNHLAIHRGEKNNKCKICGKRFARYSDTKRHVRQMHDKENKLTDLNLFVEKISDQELTFPQNEIIPEQMDTILPSTEDTVNRSSDIQLDEIFPTQTVEQPTIVEDCGKSYSCKKCHEHFIDENSLKRHSLVHLLSQEKCEFCGRMYFHLEKHIWEVHENEITTNEPRNNEIEVSAVNKVVLTGHKKIKVGNYDGVSERQKAFDAESNFICESLCALCGKQTAEIDHESGACFSCQPQKLGETSNKPYRFICNICGFKYRELFRWQQHMQSHSSSKPLSCDGCQKTFKTKRALELHRLDHKESNYLYCCDACGLIFSCPYKMKRHKKNVHQKETIKRPQYICFVCLLRTRSREQLWNHLEIHYGTEDIVCQFCDRVLKGGHELAKHGRSIHGTTLRPYSCQYCDTRLKVKNELEDHIRYNHPEHQEYPCELCDARFWMYFDLKLHILVQHEKKLKRTQSVRDLALRGKYDGPFPCTICTRIFQRKFSLNAHMKVHLGIFDYHCDFCEKKFKTKAEYNIHRRHHTQEKPYVCPYCDAKFSRQSSWLRHKRGHQGFLPYMCEKCGKRFTSPKGLRKHMQIHDREEQKDGNQTSQVLRRGGPVLVVREDLVPSATDVKDDLVMMDKDGDSESLTTDEPIVITSDEHPDMLITVTKNEPLNEDRDASLHTQDSSTAVGLQGGLMQLQDPSAMTYIMESMAPQTHDVSMATTYVNVMPRNTLVIEATDTDIIFGNAPVYREQTYNNL